jgi:hypothetical protein
MRLLDLDPRWLTKDGKRVGFIFKSPHDSRYFQSCFAVAMPKKQQFRLFEALLGEDNEYMVQPCKPEFAWTIAGGIDAATFETMTVTPSLDGSAGGLWHGFITNGEIK